MHMHMHMLRGRRSSAAAPLWRRRDVLVLNTGGACPAPAKCAYPPARPAKCAFPSLLVVFVWLLYTKNQRPAPPVNMFCNYDYMLTTSMPTSPIITIPILAFDSNPK